MNETQYFERVSVEGNGIRIPACPRCGEPNVIRRTVERATFGECANEDCDAWIAYDVALVAKAYDHREGAKYALKPKSTMTNNEYTIEVSEQTYERFHDRRVETAERDVPPMDADTFLSSLLDTQQAAREGYYSREDEIRELIEELRSYNRAEHAMFDEGQRQAADELEELLE